MARQFFQCLAAKVIVTDARDRNARAAEAVDMVGEIGGCAAEFPVVGKDVPEYFSEPML